MRQREVVLPTFGFVNLKLSWLLTMGGGDAVFEEDPFQLDVVDKVVDQVVNKVVDEVVDEDVDEDLKLGLPLKINVRRKCSL